VTQAPIDVRHGARVTAPSAACRTALHRFARALGMQSDGTAIAHDRRHCKE
jgi:hypothetical protein